MHIVIEAPRGLIVDARQGEEVYGARVAASGFLRGLIEYGNVAEVWLLGTKLQEESRQNPGARLRQLSSDTLYRWGAQGDRGVLHCNSPYIAEATRLRDRFQLPWWSATGVTHTLSYSITCLDLLDLTLSGSFPQDRIVAASIAGMMAFRRMIDGVREWLSDVGVQQLSEIEVVHIPLGINCSEFGQDDRDTSRAQLHTSTEEVIVLYFGRLSTTQKADLTPLIAACRILADSGGPSCTLVLAGDDNVFHEKKHLEFLAKSLGVKCIVIANPTNHTRRALYAAADIFVSPSDNIQETFGLTILEAMASGLPVVASDWSGYRELVVDGETGFLIPTLMGNQLQAITPLNMKKADIASHWLLGQATCIDVGLLANRLRHLASSSETRKRLGATGRRKALGYDWSRIIPRYEELWNELSSVHRETGTVCPRRRSVIDYDRQQAFEGFATNKFTEDVRLTISELGRRTMRGEFQVLLNAADPFVAEISKSVLETLEPGGSMTLGDLEESLSLGRRGTVSAHAMRLMKHGLIRATT